MTIGPHPDHRGTELPWAWAGRPVKPVALGLAVLLIGLTVYNALGTGALGDTLLSHAVAVVSAVGAASLIAGWWLRSQLMAEAGMIIAAFVLLARALAFVFMFGFNDRSWLLSLSVAIIAGGSYVLERVSDDDVAAR